MKNILNSEVAIEDLVAANCGETATARQKHIYREALRGLVRLAKAEQLREMKTSVDRLTGAIAARAARRQTRALVRRLPFAPSAGQKHLEFNQ
jgi:hypothetical protein